MESALRAVGPLRFRDRRRRVLFGNPFRRSRTRRSVHCRQRSSSVATAIRASSCSRACRSARTCPACDRGSSPGDAAILKKFPALPHLSGLRDEPAGRSGEHRRVAGRGARRREPAPLSREIRDGAIDIETGQSTSRCRMRRSTCGRARRCPIQISRAGSTKHRRYRCCRAAISRARRTASIPGTNRVRIALVASTEECAEAARRIRDFVNSH